MQSVRTCNIEINQTFIVLLENPNAVNLKLTTMHTSDTNTELDSTLLVYIQNISLNAKEMYAS